MPPATAERCSIEVGVHWNGSCPDCGHAVSVHRSEGYEPNAHRLKLTCEICALEARLVALIPVGGR